MKEICVPWGGRGCRDLKVRWWDVSYLAMWPGVCSLSRGVSVMYDVKSSSGVVTVAHGVRRGMGFFFVPFPSVYKRRSVVEDLRGGVQSIGLMLTQCNMA